MLDTLYGSLSSPPTFTTTGSLTVRFVSDASAQPQGFHLVWSANPPPPEAPAASLSAPGSCPFTALSLELDAPIECALIDWASMVTTGLDGSSWPIDTAAAANISCQGGLTDALILPLADDAEIEGNCLIQLDFLAGIRDYCDSIWVLPISAQWDATGCPVNPDIIADTDTVCTGGCATLTAVPRGCGDTDISWVGSDGSTLFGPGPWAVCPTTTTTYTATAEETDSGLSGSTSVTVTVLNLGAWVADTTLCPGTTLALSSADIQGSWSGNGVSGPAWTFAANDAGPGIHELTFSATGTASCSATTTVAVLDFGAPADIATCPESTPFILPGIPADGTWNGTGVTGSTFTPSDVTNPGGDTVVVLTFEALGCTATSQVHIEPAAPPIQLGEVCASEPAIPLPFAPPGGQWTGTGLSEQGNAILPEEVPAGPFVFDYAMEGCNRVATGVLLPIHAGPTMTSCPEQSPFVPFPGFSPPDGTWNGPGITAGAANSGLYDPGLVPDGQWSPLIYHAPNGCTDTLWMFNRQTTIQPEVVHACASDTSNLLASDGFQASPWCGWWNTLDQGSVTDLGDCQWAARATDFPVGEHLITYEVNTCVDSLLVVVHPDSIDLPSWASCVSDDPVPLPSVPLGGTWNGPGTSESGDGNWVWAPDAAGTGIHTLTWNSPPGCTDITEVEVEAPPQWSALQDTTLCFNDVGITPPNPSVPGITSGAAQPIWTVDGQSWTGDATTAEIGSGTHVIAVEWAGLACSVSNTWNLEVLPELQVNLTADDVTLCPGAATDITATPSGGLVPDGQWTISWSDGGLPLTTRTIAPTATGWWSVTVEDGCSNAAMDSILLTIQSPFDLAVTPGPLACHGTLTSILLEADQPATVEHTVNGTPLGVGPHIVEATAGEAVDWTVVDPSQGCTLDTTILVPGHPPLTAAFSINPSSDCIPWNAQPIGLIDLSTGTQSGLWSWNPVAVQGADATADSMPWQPASNPEIALPAAGTWSVTLVVAQDAGCTDTLTQDLCLLPETSLWMPDAFSPNGDGANDWFRPRGSGVIRWHMAIHDAWGRIVWEEGQSALPAGAALEPATPEGWPIGWNGDGHPPGVYAVRLEATTDDGAPVLIEQTLRLIR